MGRKLAIVGALAGLLNVAPGAPAFGAAAAAPAPLSARLTIAERHPPQLHGILLDASGSTGPIAAYVFHYGDGVVEQSSQPLALHGYRDTGDFAAWVEVLAAGGRSARSPTVHVTVHDGVPPAVSITAPQRGGSLSVARGFTLRGRASDAGGLARVEIAVQLVHPRPALHTGGRCVSYAADRRQLVLSDCGSPYFFAVGHRAGRWSWSLAPHTTLPTGGYRVWVRAIDRAGNVSHQFSVRLHTIVPFTLR